MRFGLADIRDTVLVALSCVVAGLLVLAPYNVGVPLCALALSWLSYRRGFKLAVGVAVVAGLVLALTSPLEAAFVSAVMLVAGPWAAWRMRKASPWQVFAAVMLVTFAATMAAIGVVQAADGKTLASFFTETAKLSAEEAGQTAKTWGTSTAAVQGEITAMQATLAQVMPGLFLIGAGLAALLTVYAVGWVGRREGEQLRCLPPLDRLDLSFQLTWALIAGLGGLAAAKWLGQSEGMLGAVAWNLTILARAALFLQGLSVFSALYRRVKLGRAGRVIGYVLLLMTEALTPLFIPIGLVSITGLIDLWVNIRKLPRGGGAEPGLEEPADQAL